MKDLAIRGLKLGNVACTKLGNVACTTPFRAWLPNFTLMKSVHETISLH